MKVSLGRRAIVSASALVMALAIGATAWAATTTTQSSTGSTAVTQPAAPSLGGGMRGLDGLMGGGPGGMGGRGQDQPDMTQIQEREQAMLQLVRGEMTSADQAKFDTLVAEQKTQSAAVQEALTDLQSTNDQLQTLIDTYLLPAGSTSSSSSTDDTGTTGTTSGTTGTTSATTATTSGATS